ncbi:MAG: alpha/beta hydrolase-fold protein [Acidobacteriota bacterium]
MPHRSKLKRQPAVPKGTLHQLGALHIPHVGDRICRVFVPGSGNDRKPRPVLVMWDGQNVFDDEGSYAGGWHVHRAVSTRARRGDRAPVVVAIDNGGMQRGRELSPWHRAGSLTGPLLDWIEAKLLPRIASDFGASIAARDVAIGGSSLGGLNALYAYLTRPHTFGAAIAMSPSLWASGERMFHLAAHSHHSGGSRLYIDCGGKEGGGSMALHAEKIVHMLHGRGWNGHHLMWRFVKSGKHHEKYWRARMPKALKFLYG